MTTRSSRRSSRRPAAVLGLAVGLSLALAAGSACSIIKTDGTSRATTTKKGTPGTLPTTTLPPEAFGPTTLDGVAVKLTEVAKVENPTVITSRSGAPTMFIAERPGHVRQLTVLPVKGGPDGLTVIRTDAFVERGYLLDISRDVNTDGDGGLVGMAYSSDGRKLYLSYLGKDGALHVDEYKVNDDRPNPSTKRELLKVDMPSTERIGGQVAAGPDGFLYVGVGDGGQTGAAQDPKSLLGKILRIDPEGGVGPIPYAIPDSNPHRDGSDGAPEVWLTGVRTPHFGFDETTGDLWVTDSGDKVEELNILPGFGGQAGRDANLGAGLMDGSRPLPGQSAPDGHIAPIFEYNHDRGECAAVSGFAYRGEKMPALTGAYVYGDRCTGEVRGLRLASAKASDERGLGAGVPPGTLVGFGQDVDGELWVVSSTGQVFRVDPV